MLISIIIPTRNRFDFINLMIQDILAQDISNYEIIVVDQSDNPRKIKNCNHIITNTLGPCVSRNIGAKEAKGDILVFLDDDARIYSDFIREITTPIVKGDFKVVSGAVCTPEGNHLRKEGTYLTANNENFIKVLTNNPDEPKSRISLGFPGCCAAITKEVFNEVKGFDESFDPTGAGEDREMALKLLKHGYAIWYNANAKLLHIIATHGGTRDVGSRSMMLDIHTHRMCRTHFSELLTKNLGRSILNKYRMNFVKSIFKMKLVRSKYRAFVFIKRELKN